MKFKLLIFFILALLGYFYFFYNRFNNNAEGIDYKNFQMIEYYQSENLNIPLSKEKLYLFFEYYKVFIDSKFKKPIRVEKYINNSLNEYKIFKYNEKGILINIIKYDNKDLILLEKIFILNKANKIKDVISFEYTYYPIEKNSLISKNSLKIKKEFKNNVPHGRWVYYDKKEQEIREAFYQEGILKKEWIFEYKKNNQIKIKKAKKE